MSYTSILIEGDIVVRFITTSLKSNPSDIILAKDIAKEYSFEYLKREIFSLDEILNISKSTCFFLVKNKQLILVNKDKEELFFHPGTGSIRTKALERLEKDLLIDILGIKANDSVLDCTGGLASDSIVISYFLENGNLTTLEKSSELFLITKYGLKNYSKGSNKLRESFKRINLLNIDYKLFFEDLISNNIQEKFDSIYFDPMFENPVLESSGISKIRNYASYDILTKESIDKALKLAKKRVVVKIRNNNYNFIKTTKPNKISGGSHSRIRYAVFEK